MLAEQLFHERPDGLRDVLVIFFDMRQDPADLDLEKPMAFNPIAALGMTDKEELIAHLENVEAYVLGADNADKPIGYWDRLRQYWSSYFKKAGSRVQSYSVLRESQVMAVKPS